jgi:hypothetical protein
VARRLTDERVGLLVARRREGEPGVPLDLDRALPAGRLQRLEVGSLAVAELDRLLAVRLPTPLPRRTLLRLHRASGGNPFFAQEIALAVLRNGAQDAPTEELPVPASLQGLLQDRLALLAPPALEAVQMAAALSRPTVALVDRLLGGREAVEAAGSASPWCRPYGAGRWRPGAAERPAAAAGTRTRRAPGSERNRSGASNTTASPSTPAGMGPSERTSNCVSSHCSQPREGSGLPSHHASAKRGNSSPSPALAATIPSIPRSILPLDPKRRSAVRP